jgi:hypothetical protein
MAAMALILLTGCDSHVEAPACERAFARGKHERAFAVKTLSGETTHERVFVSRPAEW